MILESVDNKILQEDIEQVVEQYSFEELKDTTILVTGATGLIGSQVIKTLACLNRMKNINVIKKSKMKRMFDRKGENIK